MANGSLDTLVQTKSRSYHGPTRPLQNVFSSPSPRVTIGFLLSFKYDILFFMRSWKFNCECSLSRYLRYMPKALKGFIRAPRAVDVQNIRNLSSKDLDQFFLLSTWPIFVCKAYFCSLFMFLVYFWFLSDFPSPAFLTLLILILGKYVAYLVVVAGLTWHT